MDTKITDTRFLTRVILKNYKSIAACDVQLRPLVFLVGPNGAGKSNFLDALRFVSDALRTTLDFALRDRGGIREVRRRSGGHPTHFGIRCDFRLDDARHGTYQFRVGARPDGGYIVQSESCRLFTTEIGSGEHYFHVSNGELRTSVLVAPPPTEDRLYLVSASGLPEFRPVYDAFSNISVYNLNPDRIRALQKPGAGDLLLCDGSNLASVLKGVRANSEARQRIDEYLAAVVPGIVAVEPREIGPMETLEFRQSVAGSPEPWRFLASNMSDGTLRALGVLTALFQSRNGWHSRIRLVCIEEPETALHPAAAGALRDSLVEASRHAQVLIASHSPDLLDDPDIEVDSILAVQAEGGVTEIAALDEAGRTALRQHLYTPGELLRMNQLMPDADLLMRAQRTGQRSHFLDGTGD